MKKTYSIIMVVFLAIAVLFTGVKVVNAESNNSPRLDVEILSVSPEQAKAGEDIKVSGVIRPEPFEMKYEEKEIMLVLDVSGSMNEKTGALCTSETIDYCINHNSFNKNHFSFIIPHKWVQCCEKHREYGQHVGEITKLDELKEAAYNFINTMKDIPNLKIAIVAYSSEAIINPSSKNGYKDTKSINQSGYHKVPNYISLGDGFLSADDDRLFTIIDTLEALGGTNTGEGLRKATYLFDKSNANKTVVLMSDGLPTFYSVANKGKNYYTNIDQLIPQYGGNGSDDNDNKCTSYAVEIGKILKDKVNNVYSIGYGLGNENSIGNKRMKEIHNSMGGVEENFFATDEGAIDSVLQQIATKITNTYLINDISLDLNFSTESGMKLNIGDNTVSLPPVEYKKVSEKNGKVRYEADEVPFSFVIKGSNAGEFELFNDSKVKFSWKDSVIENSIHSISVEIINNELPSIKANLISATPNPSKLGENVEVAYEIKPEEFEFNSSDNGTDYKDVVILIDVSSEMSNNNRWLNTRNGLDNQFVSRFTQNQNKNVRFNIITYSKEANSIFSNEFYNDQGKLHQSLLDIKETNNQERNIGQALLLAEQILQGDKSNLEASKNIVMISSGEVNTSGVDINELRNKGFNIVSVELQKEKGISLESFKNLHNELGGRNDCYISWSPDGGNYNGPDTIMKDAADKLATMIRTIYNITNVKLNFELGNDISAVSGFTSIKDNNAVIDLGTIKYKYDASSKKYKAESFTKKFIITGNKVGNLAFGKNNYLIYNNLVDKEVSLYLKTPLLHVIAPVSELKHGVYNGIRESELNIDETNDSEFAAETNINFAASFKMEGNAKATLKLDTNGKMNGEPRIFNVENNSLVALNNVTFSKKNDSEYEYDIKDIKSETQILILYGCKINEGISAKGITNNITVSTSSKNATVKVKKDNQGNDIALPDLF